MEKPSSSKGVAPKYKGVRRRKWGKWVAEVRYPNTRERLWLGSFATPEMVARAYDAAVYCLRGPGEALNFPDQPPNIPSAEKLSKYEIRDAAVRHAHEGAKRPQEEKLDRKVGRNGWTRGGVAGGGGCRESRWRSRCRTCSTPEWLAESGRWRTMISGLVATAVVAMMMMTTTTMMAATNAFLFGTSKALFSRRTLQKRSMTKSRRIQDRSKKKRVHDLEVVTECWKVASKLLVIMEVLKKEPEQVIPLKRLEQYRQQISLSKPHKVEDFIRKLPKLFEIYRDKKGVLWCGLTEQAEELVEEEARLLEEHSEKAVEHVTRLLMMSVDKRLPVDKIVHFRRDMGLPFDFRTKWIHMFPEHFKVRRIEDDVYLQLTSWNPS
ncbi:Plant organelle RNA recognition domain [Musa troglodytarum]|uniref:Plant organelle RNA recognition domain n=1 Tax=Musa troglodytarum TaxID=320322 RepID=A0A9E7IB02_9LILI|nr:Plant organelle RNA recognition domain [Musa troglodytarum]